MVWAGCALCHAQRKFIGRWVGESEVAGWDPVAEHQLQAFEVVVTGDHLLPPKVFTLTDWGVPPEQSEEDLMWQSRFAQALEEEGMVGAYATYASFFGLDIQDVKYDEFRARWAGEYAGPVTRALRKRYLTSPAGPGYVNLWRLA